MGLNDQHAAFLAIIRRIPAGWVMSYGGIAGRAGLPRHARHVGAALKHLPEGGDLPWWRVVNASGRLVPGHEREQVRLLRREGVQCAADRGQSARYGRFRRA